MDPLQAELPQSLSILPGYKPFVFGKIFHRIVAIQIFLCVTTSMILAFVLFKKYHCFGDKSWKKVTEIMGPIGNRLQNLEKEKLIWNSYLEWIEDYCSVYYSMLDYLSATIFDFDIFQREGFCSKNLLQSTASSLSDIVSLSKEDFRYRSVGDCSKSDENGPFLTNIERMLLKVQNIMSEKQGSGDVKKGESIEKSSKTENSIPESVDTSPVCKASVVTNEKPDEESRKKEEHLEMLFLEKKNICSEYRELHPVYEGQSLEL